MWRTFSKPSPIRRYATKMPAMYTPPICNIFSRESCNPNRKAIVMRRIENEHGCTLSRSDEASTKGSSHAPPLLALQMRAEVAGVNLRISIPRMKVATTPTIIRMRFILRSHIRLYLVHKRAPRSVVERYKPVYPPDTGRPVRIRVIDDADNAAFARGNSLVGGRDIPHPGHAERSFGTAVCLHEKCGRTHARSEHGLENDGLARGIGHGEFLGDVAVLHRDGAEVVEDRRCDEHAFLRIRPVCPP